MMDTMMYDMYYPFKDSQSSIQVILGLIDVVKDATNPGDFSTDTSVPIGG